MGNFKYSGSETYRMTTKQSNFEEIPKPKTFTSNALWPEGVGIDPLVSTDSHYTEDGARGVCDLLEKDGYGGEGKIFPINTWVGKNKP